MSDRYDVAILGGGFGGYVAAIRAAQLGLHTALVERDKVGGTCLHRGCIPTKALLQTAFLLDAARHGERFGVRIGEVELDYATAAKYRDQVVGQLYRGVESLLKKNGVTVVRGHGRFAGGGVLQVSGADGYTDVAAESVILASGSRVRSLPGLEIDGSHVISSDDALKLDHAPRSAVILGAGAVGVEFASMYRSMGSEVTLVEVAERLVPLEDDDVGTQLQRSFERRGIRCLAGARLDPGSLERNEGGIAVTVARDGKEERVQGELLLVAVGRAANLEDIGIDGTSVRTENGAVVVDDLQATGEPGVYAVGDMVGGFLLAHKAAHQGIIAAEAIAGQDPHPLDPILVPRTTYCSPQIGSMGLSEREARAAGHEVRSGTFPFRANSRAVIWGEAEGFCKVVTDAASDEILGVHMLGQEVTELVAGPALGALLEATPYEMSRAVAPHPTLSEVLAEAAMAVRGQAIHV
ncbi:MAG TPA: dihydrolipoyl dehydrogenase [Candidatus Dormibacteraeota bacterium]|nr:dihydrolipoyl dehydrogenase [Candidatus Dormibacteraeota bacterium]